MLSKLLLSFLEVSQSSPEAPSNVLKEKVDLCANREIPVNLFWENENIFACGLGVFVSYLQGDVCSE